MKWFEQQTILANFFSSLYKIPGVKVTREEFLRKQFKNSPLLTTIVAQGPIAAGVSQKEVKKIATSLVGKRTRQASTVSFAAGLPGGIAMTATVPADMLQFLANSLKLAQELAYLYDYDDFWTLKSETRKNELLLFLGTMLEVKGGAAAMRLLTIQHAEAVAHKLSVTALERALYWPILGEIANVIIEKIMKKTMASGMTKFIPLAGGFLSGGITYNALSTMGKELIKALEVSVHYTTEAMQTDVEIVRTAMTHAFNDK